MVYRFFIYGFIGWYIEIFWTALASLFKKDFRLLGTTSVWMFFIYGSVVFFEPVCAFVVDFPVVVKGVVYTLVIFSLEYFTGIGLKKANICPWDYSSARFNIGGVIRLDYAPCWFMMGLMFERVYLYLKPIEFHL